MVASRSTPWCRAFALAILLAWGSTPARAGFSIVDLGVIATPGTSAAMAISSGGLAAGVVTTSAGSFAASSAMGGGGFGTIAVPPGATSSLATGINGAGAVAGDFFDKNHVEHGFITTGGTPTVLNAITVNGASGTTLQVNAINGGGMVVGTGDLSNGQLRAFTSSGGATTVINPLGSGTFTRGNGINDSGTVVGASELVAGGIQHAFYTGPDGKAIDLSTRNPSGNFFFNTYGTAIANDGDIVGSGDVGNSEHAFYAASPAGGAAMGPALVDLGTLAGASSSQANGVNDNGLVVGTSGSRAFLWGGPQGMHDLNALISPLDQLDWTLTSATGINDGDQISGEGYRDGVLHGFVLVPVAGQSIFVQPGVVPTPPTLVLSAIGIAVVAVGPGRVRGRRLRPGRSGGPAVGG